MNLLRQKMALFLIDAARKGIEALDSNSACAKELEKIDIESVLNENIKRICNTASFIEITKILSLMAQLQTSSERKREVIKKAIKKIAGDVVARVESTSGKLNMPESCRHLLLNL